MKNLYKAMGVLCLFFVISCSSNVIEPELNETDQKTVGSIELSLDEKDFSKEEQNQIQSFIPTNGSWIEVGGNGSATDLEVSDKIWVIGSNGSVYYYNSPTNQWLVEPGGGSGKKITSVGNTLVITGSSNRVYTKTKGSSSSWTTLGNMYAYEISGAKNGTTLNNALYVAATDMSLYKWNNSSWMKLRDSANNFYRNYFVAVAQNFDPLLSTYISRQDSPFVGINSLYFLNPSGSYPQDDNFITNHVSDISVAPNGYVWFIRQSDKKIGFIDSTGNVNIIQSGNGKRISVSPSGVPYIIGDSSSNKIYYYSY